MEINCLQKVLKSAPSFVTYRYCHTTDVINLNWLLIAKRINYYQLKLAHKAIYEKTFPNYLKLTFKNRNEGLRKIKSDGLKLLTCNTFHGSVSSIFNELPKNIRIEMKYEFFSELIKQFLLHLPLARIPKISSESAIFLSDVHRSIFCFYCDHS